MCHEGVNRSQITHKLLDFGVRNLTRAFPTKGPVALLPPHGAESGFDPHSAYENVNDTNYFGYIHGPILPPTEQSEWLHRCFLAWCGTPKATRFGGNLAAALNYAHSLNPSAHASFAKVEESRKKMRAYFSKTLWNAAWLRRVLINQDAVDAMADAGKQGPPTGAGVPPLSRSVSDRSPLSKGKGGGSALRPKAGRSRTLLFCFMRSGPIALRRLIESTRHRGRDDFANIVIVCIPVGDSIARAGGGPAVEAAAREAGIASPTPEQRVGFRDELSILEHRRFMAMMAKVVRFGPRGGAGSGPVAGHIDLPGQAAGGAGAPARGGGTIAHLTPGPGLVGDSIASGAADDGEDPTPSVPGLDDDIGGASDAAPGIAADADGDPEPGQEVDHDVMDVK